MTAIELVISGIKLTQVQRVITDLHESGAADGSLKKARALAANLRVDLDIFMLKHVDAVLALDQNPNQEIARKEGEVALFDAIENIYDDVSRAVRQ
jgi:hypothetical protein